MNTKCLNCSDYNPTISCCSKLWGHDGDDTLDPLRLLVGGDEYRWSNCPLKLVRDALRINQPK